MQSIYKKILLKVSGEAFSGEREYGIDPNSCAYLVEQIGEGRELGVSMGVVVGGGNMFRGVNAQSLGMDRVVADHIGMLATVINSLALQENLEKAGMEARVMTALRMDAFAEPYVRRKAVKHLEKGRIVIMAAGTGNPYFTTDTAAALRGIEIGAELMLKATRVDGVYSNDPEKDPKARMFDSLSYLDVLTKNLKVMDATAISLCMQNGLPIVVFNLHGKGNLKSILLGKKIGTTIRA